MDKSWISVDVWIRPVFPDWVTYIYSYACEQLKKDEVMHAYMLHVDERMRAKIYACYGYFMRIHIWKVDHKMFLTVNCHNHD